MAVKSAAQAQRGAVRRPARTEVVHVFIKLAYSSMLESCAREDL